MKIESSTQEVVLEEQQQWKHVELNSAFTAKQLVYFSQNYHFNAGLLLYK